MTGVSSPGNSYESRSSRTSISTSSRSSSSSSMVDLVQEHHDVRNLNLTSQEHVLARLRHRAVRGRHDQDRAVHLGSARDHVLDVVGVTGAIDVRVVTVVRLVLDVRRVDRDPASLLLRGLVDVRVVHERRATALGEALRDGGGQRGLAVINVTDGPDVHVRLGPLELFLGHGAVSDRLEDSCGWMPLGRGGAHDRT